MKMRIEIDGVQATLRGVLKTGTIVDRAARAAVRTEAEFLSTESQEEVPRETGNLALSERVFMRDAPGRVYAVVEYTAPYAAAVHEIPPPPMASPSGRSARHIAPTKWKYLEDPMRRMEPGYARRIAARVNSLIDRGFAGGRGGAR